VASILLSLSIIAIVVGVAFIYWPAAFIVLGIFGVVVAVLLDLASSESEVEA
jgi:hypothetical protein